MANISSLNTSSNNFYLLSSEETLKKLNSSKNGLDDDEAQARLKVFGLNKLTSKKKVSALSIYLAQFKSLLTIILIISTLLILLVYYFGERDPADLVEAGLILGIVFIITILGFIQEYKAEKAIESLKKLLAFKAKVRRNGVEKEINVEQLIPGDIVILEEGMKIPADIRLIEVYNLTVSEASLTGESQPTYKTSDNLKEKKQIGDQKNMVFSSTSVSSGRAIGIVTATGDKTEIGKIAGLVSNEIEEETLIQKKLNNIGKILGFGVIGISTIVFIFIVFFAQGFSQETYINRILHSFIASVALAVAAIPEGLPAVVTISLAIGTQRMLKKQALIRKLSSVETLGSTDIICSDKTGTLTKGEMTVKQIYFNNQNYLVSGSGYETVGKFSLNSKTIDPSPLSLILKTGLYCNNASITGNKVTGDPTEAALILSSYKAGITKRLERIFEVPFDSVRKMMSTVVKEENITYVYSKGAVEELLKRSSRILIEGKVNKLTEEEKQKTLKAAEQMSASALRVLAFAYKDLDKNQSNFKNNPKILEEDLIFLGLQGMIDPPRSEVKGIIQACQQSGIRVIMITGDHIETAKAVAQEIGIKGKALSGPTLDEMSDEELEKQVEQISIYARVSPGFKMRIIQALKKNGHTVAMTGDGVNDAPALKKADIGIAMGITGTDVSKEASDMVLLDDKFDTIVSAIEEGRGIYINIRKFVNFLIACNIGEVLVVFLAVVIFKELPLTATMLLWINVVTDGLPALALGIDPREKNILKYKPKMFQEDILNKKTWAHMLIFGAILTFFTLGLYWANIPEGDSQAKAAAFSAIVVFEMIYIFIIRSNYKIGIFSNKWLLAAVFISLSLHLLIIYNPFLASIFQVGSIDIFDWIFILMGSIVIWFFFKLIDPKIDNLQFLQSKNS